MKIKKILKPADLIIFATIIVISFLPSVFAINELNSQNPQIVVYHHNNEIARFPLNDKDELVKYQFEFEVNEKEYIGILETKNSSARLLRLSKEVVPKSIHSDTSWISNNNQTIVALPVSLMVTIENTENNETNAQIDVDAVVY